jgi:hypothetical protein
MQWRRYVGWDTRKGCWIPIFGDFPDSVSFPDDSVVAVSEGWNDVNSDIHFDIGQKLSKLWWLLDGNAPARPARVRRPDKGSRPIAFHFRHLSPRPGSKDRIAYRLLIESAGRLGLLLERGYVAEVEC